MCRPKSTLQTRTLIYKTKTLKVPWCQEEVFVVGLPRKYWKTETGFQIYAATWLRKYHPEIRFHHSANERSGGLSGLRCKLMGQAKGMPDLIVFGATMAAYELKVPGGSVSGDQFLWLEYLRSIGWRAQVVWSFEEFRKAIGQIES